MAHKPNSTIQPSTPPALPHDRIMVAVTGDVEHELQCALDFGLGAEVQTFSFPTALNRLFADDLNDMVERLASVQGPIGCHGAFLDTVHHSQDLEIRKVARMRYLQSLDVAETLGADYVLFHSQYNPIIRVPVYPEIYRVENLKFWPDIIAEAERRNVKIYIENMFDDSPEPVRQIMDELDSPFFKACLDIAHAAVWSDLDLSEWIDALRPHLAHVHMNDCSGKQDDHFGLGQGALDLPRALNLLGQTGLPLTYALETGKYTEASLDYLAIPRAQP